MRALRKKRGAVRPRRGRPAGARVQLLRDPRRFQLAAFVAAVELLGLREHEAARLVVLAFSTKPIAARGVDEAIMCISGSVGCATAAGREGGLVRKAGALRATAGAVDLDWLASSIAHIGFLIVAHRQPPVLANAIDHLVALGWGPTLAALAGRIGAATNRTNYPPHDDRVSRRVAELIDRLRGRAEKQIRPDV